MEYIAAPIISLLLALKFTDWKAKKLEERISSTYQQIELVKKDIELREAELPKKVMTTVIPLAKAVKTLNQQVGL
jgi:hypothetical protein